MKPLTTARLAHAIRLVCLCTPLIAAPAMAARALQRSMAAIDSVPSGHHGLLGMRVRVESHGGELRIHSSPGRGTRRELGYQACLVSCAIGLGRCNLGFVLMVSDAFQHRTPSDTIRGIHQIPAN